MRTKSSFFKHILSIFLVIVSTNMQAQEQPPHFEGSFLVTLNNSIASLSKENRIQIVSAFQEGAAIFKSADKYGLINQQGYQICGANYSEINLFQNGYASVRKQHKWTFINKQGMQLTPLRYDWVGGFENNHAAVMYNGKWGVLNEQGYEVIPTQFEGIRYETGYFMVKLKGKWSYYDNKSSEYPEFM